MWARDERKFLVVSNTVNIPPCHVSIILLKLVGHMVLWPNTLYEIAENPFPLIEEPNVAILPVLEKVGDRFSDEYITTLCNQGGHPITLKENTTAGYVKEAYAIYMPFCKNSILSKGCSC